MLVFFRMLRRRPISTLFPYTTLFRSRVRASCAARGGRATARPAPGERLPLPVLRLARHRAREHLRADAVPLARSEEHTSGLQSHSDLVCRLLLEKKKRRVSRSYEPSI